MKHDLKGHSPIDVDFSIDEAIGLPGAINHARPRPKHIPRHTSGGYAAFKRQKQTAFRAAVHNLEQELGAFSTVSHITIHNETLTLHPRSQSKLSQQELNELSKATHFSRNELQAWYKGV